MKNLSLEPFMSDESRHAAKHYALVARAIAYIHAHAQQQPGLNEIAAAAGLSSAHLQRVFAEWAGVSPKQFLQFITREHAKAALRCSADVLTASLDAGLSSASRLHDLMLTWEAMTPGEVKAQGAGLTLAYGLASTPFGTALFAWTQRGLCHLEFYDGVTDEANIAPDILRAHWPLATLAEDPAQALQLSQKIFAPMNAPPYQARTQPHSLHLLLRGSAFQLKVWEALLRTKPAQLLSYGQLAVTAGMPQAPRAVGSAVAANVLAYLIPCHRIIRETGDFGQYRWGPERKLALHGWETTRSMRKQGSLKAFEYADE